MQYNREPILEFSFRRHNCLSTLLDDINDTEFMNGVSNLGRALEKVMKYAFTQARVWVNIKIKMVIKIYRVIELMRKMY